MERKRGSKGEDADSSEKTHDNPTGERQESDSNWTTESSPHVKARVKCRPALPHENVTSPHNLPWGRGGWGGDREVVTGCRGEAKKSMCQLIFLSLYSSKQSLRCDPLAAAVPHNNRKPRFPKPRPPQTASNQGQELSRKSRSSRQVGNEPGRGGTTH
jgi:hypothetical protein